jgi:hypothetical protein
MNELLKQREKVGEIARRTDLLFSASPGTWQMPRASFFGEHKEVHSLLHP